MAKGALIVISGFAGSGKGTIIRTLMERYDGYGFSVSATTRAPRPGETDGKEYFFISKEKFEDMIEKGEFLEHASYVGNYYGTPKAYVEKLLNDGVDVILDIEYQGAFNCKKVFPEAVLFFITPPSVTEVYNRLEGRATETEDVIIKRLERGREEADVMGRYDFIIVNDDLDTAVTALHNAVQASKDFTIRKLSFIEELKCEFDTFLNKNAPK